MPIQEGDTFTSLQEFKDCLRRWAISENWTPHILDSDKRRVRAGCRSAPDCPFRIRAHFNAVKGQVLVSTCDGDHTCFQSRNRENPLHQNIKRSETGKLRFLLGEVPKLLDVTVDTKVQDIIDAVEEKHGQKIPLRQAQRVKTKLTPHVSAGPCRKCGQMGHTRRQCPQLKHPASTNRMTFSINDITDPIHHDEHDAGDDLQSLSSGGGPAFEVTDQTNNIHATHNPISTALDHLDPALVNHTHVHDQPPAPQIQPLQPNGGYASQESPAEARMRASQLMQDAARLMEQAAKLNAEAARLNASVAHL